LAFDRDPKRLDRLKANAAATGATNIVAQQVCTSQGSHQNTNYHWELQQMKPLLCYDQICYHAQQHMHSRVSHCLCIVDHV